MVPEPLCGRAGYDVTENVLKDASNTRERNERNGTHGTQGSTRNTREHNEHSGTLVNTRNARAHKERTGTRGTQEDTDEDIEQEAMTVAMRFATGSNAPYTNTPYSARRRQVY